MEAAPVRLLPAAFTRLSAKQIGQPFTAGSPRGGPRLSPFQRASRSSFSIFARLPFCDSQSILPIILRENAEPQTVPTSFATRQPYNIFGGRSSTLMDE